MSDGQTFIQTDEQHLYRQTDKHFCRQMDFQTNGLQFMRTEGQKFMRTYGQKLRHTDKNLDIRTNIYRDGRTDGRTGIQSIRPCKSSCQEEEEEEQQQQQQQVKVVMSRSVLRTCYRNYVAAQVKKYDSTNQLAIGLLMYISFSLSSK